MVFVLAGLGLAGRYDYSKIKMNIVRMHVAEGNMPPGLVALWSGEGDGKDSIGGNAATLTDITFTKGIVGQAFHFNGKSSSIRISASPSLDVGADQGFTIMAWIKPSNVKGLHPLI